MRRRIARLFPVFAAGAIVAYVLRRMRGGDEPAPATVSSREPRADAGAPPSDEPASDTVESTYACEGCGTEYRVSGEGRHRVYWKAGASITDAVLDAKCVECEKPLPGHHPSEDRDDGDEGTAKAADAGEESAEKS